MEDKIIEYVKLHPVLASIIIPIVLGVLVSFFIGLIQYMIYGNKNTDLDDEQLAKKNKIDNIFFRLLTIAVSIVCALLALDVLGDLITSLSLKILFVILNTSIPFAFYHLKGKQIIEVVINKLFSKIQKAGE